MEKAMDTKVFGFLVYLMTDLIIFAVLFACFIVLHQSTHGGPTGPQLFELPAALAETIILLTSSFTCSVAMIAIHLKNKMWATVFFGITFALGIAFLALEISEFILFLEKGASWEVSAFLSSFFTLVGTHGLHIACGLIWMIVVIFRIWIRPLGEHSVSRIYRMALFWHFLDFVWIFIFTVVYGMGSMI